MLRNDELTIFSPIVSAIAVVKRSGPMRQHTDASAIAFIGESALVAITAAMELAASLRPLTKLNIRARKIPSPIMTISIFESL